MVLSTSIQKPNRESIGDFTQGSASNIASTSTSKFRLAPEAPSKTNSSAKESSNTEDAYSRLMAPKKNARGKPKQKGRLKR